jgi:integrase
MRGCEMRVSALIDWYYQSRSFAKLKPNSVRQYRHLLHKAEPFLRLNWDVHRINAIIADSIFDDLSRVFSKHCAVSTCRILSHIWNLGLRYGHVSNNPFKSMELPALQSRTNLWTEEQVHDFITTCEASGYASLGLMAELCYLFAQRPGDMRKLRWNNIIGQTLEFRQEKTNSFISVFIPPSFMMRLDMVRDERSNASDFICINPDTGNGYTERDYNTIAFDMKRKAHIPIELQLRDLRATAITESDEFESSVVRRITGHKTERSYNIYRRPRSALTEKLMESRGKRLKQHSKQR